MEGDRAVLCLAAAGAGRVERVMETTLPPEGSAEKGAFLRERLSREGLAAERVVLAVPRRLVLMKPLSLPAAGPRELAAMASLQIPRLLPIPLEEVETDAGVLERTKDGSRVLLLAVRREDLREPLEILDAAGLPPRRIVPDSYALLNLLRRRFSGPAPLLILSAAGSGCDLSLVRSGGLISSWRLPHLNGAAAERDGSVQALRLALERENIDIGAVRILGVGAAGADQALRWGQVLSVPVEAVNPLDQVIDSEPSHPLVCAAGAALLEARGPNLLPLERRIGFTSQAKRKAAARLGAFVLLTLVIMGGILFIGHQRKKAKLAALEERLHDLAPQVEEVRRMAQRLERLARRSQGAGSLSEVLARLGGSLPERAGLTAVTFERDRRVILQGEALSFSEAAALAKRMEKSPPFADVEIQSSSVRRVQGRDITVFQLEARMTAPEPSRAE